jgi:membrane protein YdbS with pleckstrin-like domain
MTYFVAAAFRRAGPPRRLTQSIFPDWERGREEAIDDSRSGANPVNIGCRPARVPKDRKQQARLQRQGEIMRYVEDNLTEGERIIHTTRLHWIVLVGPAFAAGLLVLAGIGFAFNKDLRIGALIMPSLGAIVFFWGWVRRRGFEFAVTNKRVICRKGIVSVSTDEMFVDKIESVLVKQGILERWLGFGSVTVRGIGGSWEPFQNIADPLLLRRRIQEQIERRTAPVTA